MRDYIHVVDLAKGHLAALNRLNQPGFEVYNLGTGNATTVLQLVNTFKSIAGVDIPFELVERRPGDAGGAPREACCHEKQEKPRAAPGGPD